MDSPGAVGRRRGNTRSNAEDQALDQIAREVSRLFSFFRRLFLKRRDILFVEIIKIKSCVHAINVCDSRTYRNKHLIFISAATRWESYLDIQFHWGGHAQIELCIYDYYEQNEDAAKVRINGR